MFFYFLEKKIGGGGGWLELCVHVFLICPLLRSRPFHGLSFAVEKPNAVGYHIMHVQTKTGVQVLSKVLISAERV